MVDIAKISITDMSDMGQGIGRLDNVVVFVDDALPGDVVEAGITEQKKNYLKAKVVNILESSPHGVDVKCPYQKACGGCGYMALDYNYQLGLKELHVREKLERIAGIKYNGESDNGSVTHNDALKNALRFEPAMGMDEPFFYRNKTEFTVSKGGKVGFNRQGSHEVVDIPKCFISSPVTNTILNCFKSYISGNSLNIGKLTVRTSFSTGETMVILDIANDKGSHTDELMPLVEAIDDAVNELYNGEVGNVVSESHSESIGDGMASPPAIPYSLESVYICNRSKGKNKYRLIAGKPTINDEFMGLKFEISPESFYQVNSAQAENLFKKVAEYAGLTGREKVFDLYCGVGSIGLTLAGSAKEVWGVESVKSAVLDANRNAVINGIINARYIHGKAEEMMDNLDIDESSVVLLDPPRAGCRKEVLEAIGASKAGKIVYVSCDPATFSRDARILADAGFSPEKITVTDMFPQTAHTELAALFVR